MRKTKRKIVSDIHVLIHVFIHVNACHLFRSSRVSNSWAQLVPFSPFFSGFSFASCPRSSFKESVSVTVLKQNFADEVTHNFWVPTLVWLVLPRHLFLSSSLSYFSLQPKSAVLLRVSSTSRFLIWKIFLILDLASPIFFFNCSNS